MSQTMLLTSTVNTQNEIRPATIFTINMFIAFDQSTQAFQEELQVSYQSPQELKLLSWQPKEKLSEDKHLFATGKSFVLNDRNNWPYLLFQVS